MGILGFSTIQPGARIQARDINFLVKHLEEVRNRPLDPKQPELHDIPCRMNVNVVRFQYLQITPDIFHDDAWAWITVGTAGHNWVMFDADYDAGTTGVCRVIPYDRPVMLRTGGNPQNGLRYDIADMQASDEGEFTCVGKTLDPAVFWYIRNAGVGGGGTAPLDRDFCQIIAPVSNGFLNRPVSAAAETETVSGWNGARSGLGSLQSRGAGNPLGNAHESQRLDSGMGIGT